MTTPTASARAAEAILRDGGHYQWHVVPLLAFVVYVYATEVEARRWSTVFAGLSFWGMDWFNEVCNSLVYHFTGYAPVWAAPSKTAYLFALSGIIFVKLLPSERRRRVLGLDNRLVVAVTGSAFCVLVELWLNSVGALTWDYSWWSVRAPWLIFLLGYLPFFLVAFWVYDMPSLRRKAAVTGGILAFDAICLAVFGPALRWI
jgi:FtsH-binding integral membrane protein